MTDAETADDASGNLHLVCSIDDLSEGGRAIVLIEGREIAVFELDGRYYALADYCPHQGGPACEGVRKGTIIVDDDGHWGYDREDEIVCCPWHGWEYDIRTGENLSDSRLRLPSYETVVDDGSVYIAL